MDSLKNIKVEEKSLGEHIAFSINENNITFGEEELSINLEARERDYKVQMDICRDMDGALVIGTGGNATRYVAQVLIPGRIYEMKEGPENEEGEKTTIRVPVPFDISRCTLYLWGGKS